MSLRAKEKQPFAVNFVVLIYRLAYNLTDIVLLPEAKSVGMALADATLAYDPDIDIIGVTRNGAAQIHAAAADDLRIGELQIFRFPTSGNALEYSVLVVSDIPNSKNLAIVSNRRLQVNLQN